MDVTSALVCAAVLVLTASATPLSPPSARIAPLSSLSALHHKTQHPQTSKQASARCSTVEIPECSNFYTDAQMPNIFGHYFQAGVSETLRGLFSELSHNNRLITSFLCVTYIPPCPSQFKVTAKAARSPLPCRKMCADALKVSKGSKKSVDPKHWPIKCHALPSDNCFEFDGANGIKFVKNSTPPKPERISQPKDFEGIARFAPLDVELGPEVDEDENRGDDIQNGDGEFKVEVVSVTTSRTTQAGQNIPARRYDIADLGDPAFFQGWVDVQGSGAANDYCRVVGKGKRRFLSCNLAGISGQGHHYVSKLGFDPGHPGTWFMRDMDGDGRDDYCRCVGTAAKSLVTCMKAGKNGFHGSPTQGGVEHTFRLPGTHRCTDRRVNLAFGE